MKADIFNSFFAKQCSLINSDSSLPSKIIKKTDYCHISLLPIRDKIFERTIYSSLFDFLNQNDLIYPAQSGFKPGDFCINQLLLTHDIYHSMDEGYENRGVCLIYRIRLIRYGMKVLFLN